MKYAGQPIWTALTQIKPNQLYCLDGKFLVATACFNIEDHILEFSPFQGSKWYAICLYPFKSNL